MMTAVGRSSNCQNLQVWAGMKRMTAGVSEASNRSAFGQSGAGFNLGAGTRFWTGTQPFVDLSNFPEHLFNKSMDSLRSTVHLF